jgi:uncharacterized OB-fold protein
MTAPGNLVCTKCGYTNVPGDQFCGSCGAFLEWEGVAPAGPAGDAPSPFPADVPLVGPPAAKDLQATGPAATSDLAPDPFPTPAGGALIRCPACGIANAPGRTFCQSCGTKLPETAAVQAASAEQIAAAVAARNLPPAARVGASTAEPARASGRGGVARWLIAVGLLGLIVGVAVVAGTTLLRGRASSDASANPSLGALPTIAASGGAPPSAGGASGAPGSSAAPAVSVPLALSLATASSVVGDLVKFQATKAIDGDPNTCWQEGNATEKGEWIEVTFPASRVTSLILTNGYNASRALYRGNHRLKDIQVSIDGGAPVARKLKDIGTPQRIEVPPVDGATKVKITIVSIYPGVKTKAPGTPFDDAALAEIVVMGVTAP